MQQQQWVWAVVIVGAIVGFFLPVIIAAIRGVDPMWPVVVLTLITPLGGFWWFGAWFVAFAAPRRSAAVRRHAPPVRTAPPGWTVPPARPALPARDDPMCLYGAVRPRIPRLLSAGARLDHAWRRSGVSVWS